MGTKDQRFEVSCKDRTGQGVRRQRVIQDCLITPEGKVFCRCNKPQLLHLPCSHAIAACSESGLDPVVFVSQYYRKETAVHTWGHEIYGIGSLGSFTTPYISNHCTKSHRGGEVFLQIMLEVITRSESDKL